MAGVLALALGGPVLAAGDTPLVAYVLREEPPAFTAQGAQHSLGLVGALAGLKNGKDVAARFALEDPANGIGAELVRAWAASHQAAPAANPVRIGAKQTLRDVPNPEGARYLVSVITIQWGYRYLQSDFGRFGIVYEAYAGVFDRETNKPLAQGHCVVKPKGGADAPTQEALLANEAEALKAGLTDAGQACLRQLREAVPAFR